MAGAVFIFGGQGPEWWAMGRELFATEPAFAEVVGRCDTALGTIEPGRSIERELRVPEVESRIGDVEVLQPLLFTVHAGIVAVLKTMGVEPVAAVGQSFGELSAAYAAGAISLEDAMRIHVARSRVMKRLANAGRMAVVETGPDLARRAIAGSEDKVAVGVINSPESVVLSGEHEALSVALARLASEGVGHREIRMPYPVHGPQMHAVMDEVTGLLAAVKPCPPEIPLFSTVYGGEGGDFGPRHWARNIGEPALFADAIGAILSRGWSTFIEIGPHPTLGGAIAQCAAHRGIETRVLPSLRRQRPERAALLETVNALARVPTATSGLTERLRAASSAERTALLVHHLKELIALRVGVQPSELNSGAGYGELGLESAAAVEISAVLARELMHPLPATLLFEHPSISATAGFLLAELGLGTSIESRRTRQISSTAEPIAIVGVGCRFPGGVDNPDAFWQLLEEGRDAVTEVPASRWNVQPFYDPDLKASGKTYSKWGGFLDERHDGRTFDAAFFGISPREAQSMDPQQRLLLEVAWEAFEHAGVAPHSLAGSRTGVFVGICTGDYGGRVLHSADLQDLDPYTFTGNSPSVAAGRLAYVFGLEGPALVVDTACSSSLVALHLACRSLRSGESDLALAGGVNLILSPTLHVYFSRLRAMSPTGRSRAFDASADGYVRGEGCGLVVLKRLSDAQAAGDRILAVVRGTAVNQDGRSSGLTAPNGLAQQAVIREALRDAGISPAQMGYVEAHGTGTPLGDPIELRALSAVLSEGRPPDRPFVVGSVKTNIGHTEGAAGIAGVIKASLALSHRRIPRSLHFQTPNPHIQWDEMPARVAAEAMSWDSDGPRFAGVSSFGFSGTNAHIVLEAAPPPAQPEQDVERAVPLLLSGRTEEAVRAKARHLTEHLEAHPEIRVVDVATTLATGRTHFDHRTAVVASDRADLIRALSTITPAETSQHTGQLAYLFTGQGSQRLGMGRVLYERFAAFREAFDAVLAVLGPRVRDVIWGDAEQLERTEFAQPALFAVEVALFRLFEAWGVKPTLLAGHSVGEITAAHVAGMLSLEDAGALVTARGTLMQALPGGGAMVSIEATAEEVRPLVADYAQEIALAAINAPRSVVISGDEERALSVAGHFAAMGRRTTRLAVSHAFHSPRIDPMLAELRTVAARLNFGEPQTPIISTLTAKRLCAAELATGDYWARQARGSVDFAGALQTLAEQGVTTFLELGPRGILSALGVSSLPDASFIPTLRQDQPEDEGIAHALARLHLRAVEVDWAPYFAALGGRRSTLPSYPFQRKRHWIDERPRSAAPTGLVSAGHPLLATSIPLATGGHLFTGRWSLAEQPWLAGHAVFDTVILPGTAFLDLALEAARQTGTAGVEELIIEAPLTIPPNSTVDVQLVIGAMTGGRRSLSLHARTGDGAWTRHATGTLGDIDRAAKHVTWLPDRSEAIDLQGLYKRLESAGLSYGDDFRRIRAAWRRDSELFVEVAGIKSGHVLDPMLLDAALHLVADDSLERTGTLALPFSWSGVTVHRAAGATLRVVIKRNDDGAVAIDIASEHGELVAQIAELRTRPAVPPGVEHAYRLEWTRLTLPRNATSAAWSVIGSEVPGLNAAKFETVAELQASLDRGAPAPPAVALHFAAADDARAVHTVTHGALLSIQALLADTRFDAVPIVVLTWGAVAPLPDDWIADVSGAAAAGLLRSAGSEYPSRRIIHVDLDSDQRSIEALPAAVAHGEPQIALRAGAAWIPRLTRARLARTPRKLCGTVLITGGTGALGALVARHLVRVHGARDLLLASRRGLAAPGVEAVRDELESEGARVVIVACDVADSRALRDVLATIPKDRPLCGVIHAAGELDDGVITSLDPGRIDRVFAPKVDAAYALDAALGDQPLDFFVLFSSAASLFGPAGQGAYAAANAALDAIAQRRRAQGRTALSINYGPWQAGMAAQLSAADERRLSRYGMTPLSVEAALAALDAALMSTEARIAAIALQPVSDSGQVPAIWRHLVVRESAAPVTAPSAERRDDIPEVVRAEVARALGLASPGEVAWDAPFRDLGMDSLVAVELRNALARRLEVALPATLLFDYPNARALSRSLSERFAPPAPKADPTNIDAMNEHQLDELLASLQGEVELQ